jgi:hypothetical protein
VIVLALRDVTHRLEIFVATTMNNITYEYLKGVRGREREREREDNKRRYLETLLHLRLTYNRTIRNCL